MKSATEYLAGFARTDDHSKADKLCAQALADRQYLAALLKRAVAGSLPAAAIVLTSNTHCLPRWASRHLTHVVGSIMGCFVQGGASASIDES